MKVLQFTTADGREFFTNSVPKDSKGIEIKELKLVDMTKEEYARIPASLDSFRFFRDHVEPFGSIEGFEAPNSPIN
jgi:hypothetical protein